MVIVGLKIEGRKRHLELLLAAGGALQRKTAPKSTRSHFAEPATALAQAVTLCFYSRW
jgi:hypothetical protein